MFNIQPGQGLGLSASKEIALGLGTTFIEIVEVIYAEFIRGLSLVSRAIMGDSPLNN